MTTRTTRAFPSAVAILLAAACAGGTTQVAGTDAGEPAIPASVDGAQGATGSSGKDSFGVLRLYPTKPGGREWSLPDDADLKGAEWQPEGASVVVSRVEGGAFHTEGEEGQVRLNVTSPAGKSWWGDVEMTGYFRQTGAIAGSSQEPHWEILARGERHSSTATTGDRINGGVAAPAGTRAWPGYPFGAVQVNPHCLGTAYHGNAYPSGRVLFEKEISHTEGYGEHQRNSTSLPVIPQGSWFGLKFVVRSSADDRRVHLELWLDAAASQGWTKVIETEDVVGSWIARTATLDGCTAAPFRYTVDQLITWAGPWVTFRSDAMAIDFKWLSVREIGPLP